MKFISENQPLNLPRQCSALSITDEHWHLQWYPETPIGFIHVSAPTLAEVLKLANPDELPLITRLESALGPYRHDLVISRKEAIDLVREVTRTQEKP